MGRDKGITTLLVTPRCLASVDTWLRPPPPAELGTRTPPLPPSPPGGRPGVTPATSASPPPAGGTPGCQRVSPRSWSRCSRLQPALMSQHHSHFLASPVGYLYERGDR